MEAGYATERLFLKIIDESYADQILEYYLRNRDFLKEWEALTTADFYTREYQKEQLAIDWENMERGNLLRLWIFKKDRPDRPIGTMGFSQIVRGSFLSCFLGYKLDAAEINKGFMTEALKKGIEIIFEDFGLHRIEANIMPKNKRSLRVVEKLGFYKEGLAYNYLKINGEWENHIHHVLLNDKV
ncbi:MAG: Ribosomal-protein-alanine N-acetyltransferase [Firmicutes bacterium]|nr:Ribosomal-protein-alanine N-acetyltransferase [Bacillota bacterium]